MEKKIQKKATKKSKVAKIDKDRILKSFIKKGKGAANAIANADEMKSKLHQLESSDQTKYQITPKGVLYSEIDKEFGAGNDFSKFERFQKNLLKRLSQIASGGDDSNIFSGDFNDFFKLVVDSLNLAGKMKQVLDENGIEFDIQKFLGGEEEDDGSIK